jgi:hypothetical protein
MAGMILYRAGDMTLLLIPSLFIDLVRKERKKERKKDNVVQGGHNMPQNG